MRRRLRALPSLTLALILVGCNAGGATMLTRLVRDRPLPAPVDVPADGKYGLYSPTDVTPKAVYTLQKGERVGFRSSEGKTFAIAGANELPIDLSGLNRSFEWRRVQR